MFEEFADKVEGLMVKPVSISVETSHKVKEPSFPPANKYTVKEWLELLFSNISELKILP